MGVRKDRMREKQRESWTFTNSFGPASTGILGAWHSASVDGLLVAFNGNLTDHYRSHLPPFLPDFVETGFLEIIRGHNDSKFDTGIESQKPGFS